MKHACLILFGIVVCISNEVVAINNFIFGKTTLSGKITNKKTGASIPGVSIYLPDLKTGTTSGMDGTYKIENLSQSKVLVQVTYIGYKLIAENVDLTVISTRDFALEESINELNEVVVTGLSKAAEKNRTPTSISTIPSLQLLQSASANIIDALSKQAGVSQVTTGSGISKPVIRGLGYNRVVTVNDGIRQEGQQWGDEHGIEIDEFSINKIEILKGPASLAYGSDAMAGVINMLSAPTLPDGKITGNILLNHQTNNGLIGYSANLAGNQNGFIWNIRYSNKMAHAYRNKYDGFVFNSGYRENTVTGITGFNKSWGYSHLHFSSYQNMPGIVEGDRDSLTGKFIKSVATNDTIADAAAVPDRDYKSYHPLTPYQKIHHYKAVLNNSFIIGYGSLKINAGFQQNHRQEYADILEENQYGLYFLLNTLNYDIQYILPERNNFNVSIGVNGMNQLSQNKGTEYLIPDYTLSDAGIFILIKKTIHNLDISGGLRYDSRNEKGKDLFVNADGNQVNGNEAGAIQQFTSFHSAFSGISGNIGATYQFSEKIFSKANISRGFRAPNITELSANGVHEGTLNYILGVPALKAENSLQLDYALGINADHITGEVDIFNNSISHFIFLSKLRSVSGGDSLTDGFSTFRYSSGDANLMGGEISIDIHPHPFDWLHFENTFSYVQSIQKHQPDSTKYLPFTPAPKLTSELKAMRKNIGKILTNTYLKIEVENYFTQNKFYSAFETETATPGYTIVNLGTGADINLKNKTLFSLYISINNLIDAAYQSHLSRLKYEAINNLTGRTGVFNMGRNISLKLLVPVDFRKAKNA